MLALALGEGDFLMPHQNDMAKGNDIRTSTVNKINELPGFVQSPFAMSHCAK